MSYNPFIKGNYPVGVRTVELEGKDNTYTTEVWYPAAAEYRATEAIDKFKIVDELPEATQEAVRNARSADGKRPIVMYWHGGYGHRREMAAMCVFLASHGFVVAAPDFPGDHITFMYGADPKIANTPVDASAEARGRQGAEVIDLLADGNDKFLKPIIDRDNIGSFGLSLGGFTTLAVNATSARVKASLPIAPAYGSRSPLPQMVRLTKFLRLEEWKSPASTVVLTGSADALVVVGDVRELYSRLPEPKRLAVLKDAGHLHWGDSAELIHETIRLRYLSGEFPDPEIDGPAVGKAFRPFSELCPAEHAIDAMRSIGLAHFETNLKDCSEARAFLASNLAKVFASRGIDVEVSDPQVMTVGN
ncbi:MAG: dienelactone hydrolase family protein [Pyrinomonadaceae bacterium]